MDLEFVKLNWHLFAALAAIVALLAFEPLRQRAGGIGVVNAMDLPRVMRNENAVVIDVSDPKDFERGRVPKARNIPLSRISTDINVLSKFKSRPIVVVCRLGNRSQKAAGILRKNEFADVRTLRGGFAAWAKENLPIEK